MKAERKIPGRPNYLKSFILTITGILVTALGIGANSLAIAIFGTIVLVMGVTTETIYRTMEYYLCNTTQ
ncbi:hypothetical protein [Methanoplanus limicola]|uniref:hypothetical protein n=1 Tax=Methanoplanus limicola TaxID=2315 RepID=UPI0012F651AF|nr:hypothetical protein [Methanoplanus limicola]